MSGRGVTVRPPAYVTQLLPSTCRQRSGQNVPVLTSKLDLYDESNPYNPLAGSWASTS